MFKKKVHKPLPAGAKVQTRDGVKQAFVEWGGKRQWLPVSPQGKIIGLSSKWYARIGGKDVPLARDKVTAEKRLNDLRVNVERVSEGIALPLTEMVESWPELLERFRKEKSDNHTPKYSLRMCQRVEKILEALGVDSLESWRKVTTPMIKKVFERMPKASGDGELINSSLKVYSANLQVFGKWLRKQKLVGELPEFPQYKLKKVAENPRVPITKEMLAKLVAVAPHDVGLFYRLAFATLARVGAIFATVAEDYDLDDPNNATLKLRAENAKTGVGQNVSIPPSLAKDLKPLVEKAGGGRVFPRFRTATISRRLDIDLKAAGIEKYQEKGKLCAHSFRHGGATHLLKAGVSPFIVMKVGGWANMQMLIKHYGQLMATDAHDLICKLMD